MEKKEYQITKESFRFTQEGKSLKDKAPETKPVGYFKDAFRRFARNKASVVAAVIIGILLLYALIVPIACNTDFIDAYSRDTAKGEAADTDAKFYQYLLPKVALFEGTGFWDGTQKKQINNNNYVRYKAIEQETGAPVITKYFREIVEEKFDGTTVMHEVRVDSYRSNAFITKTVTGSEYEKIQAWQQENNIQVLFPVVDPAQKNNNGDITIWYKCKLSGAPIYAADGKTLQPAYKTNLADDYNSLRIAGDDGSYAYANRTGKPGSFSYECRINAYNYFIYKYGLEPCFALGTTDAGYDLLTRLASGARFSFILAICIATINLLIGAIYGAIEGFYGGVIDLAMERFSDILSGIPFTVVTVLFQMHLKDDVGVVGSLIFAFVLTGWIGTASTVRMQFYRYKNREYVLAARTLGATDARLMFKHIFPNALGTLITGSVLVIPGVMLSETSLTYLGIVNLDTGTMSSVGSLLSAGQACISSYPHIVLYPAVFFSLLMISFNLFGNGLRDAFNPSLRGSEEG